MRIVRWLLGSALVSGTLAIGSTSCGSNSPVGWDDSGAAPDAGADSGKIAGDADASNGPDVSGGADGGLDGAVLYVTNDDGTLYAYQVGTWTKLATWPGLPFTDGVRGVDADPANGVLYIAHGGDSLTGDGHLLAWSLLKQKIVYDIGLKHGIDQFAFGEGKIYMPAGELANSTTWYVLNANDGSQTATETGGSYPHNTMFQNGHRYYGGRQSNSLVIVGIGAGSVGPSPSSEAGVRPFTVNAAETRVWITWTRYRGFSVGDVQSGHIVKSVNFGAIPSSYAPTAASHGVTLAPNGSEVYVLDTPYDAVRAYDGTDNPQLISTIQLQHAIVPGNESPCAYDCPRDGWLLHSRDGKYVYVGDSGDVIDTQKHQVTGFVAALQNSRHGFIEVDWSNGVPVSTTTHFGHGY